AMKKIITVSLRSARPKTSRTKLVGKVTRRKKGLAGKITVGIDLGDRSSCYCALDDQGEIVQQGSVATTKKDLNRIFGALAHGRIALEVGTHSPWVSRHIRSLGHEVIVANPRRTRLIGASSNKSDRLDAETLARLARVDPRMLFPIQHRGETAQADLTVIRARAGMVESRTALINAARGLSKSFGERLRKCDAKQVDRELAKDLPEALRAGVEPLLEEVATLTERIRAYDERIEGMARERYPEVALLRQVYGVGVLIALTFILTIDDRSRFPRSRDVGCYLGMRPKKKAHRGVARKLAILLHPLWVTGELYEPLRASQSQAAQPVAA